jgi:hypothetical protein
VEAFGMVCDERKKELRRLAIQLACQAPEDREEVELTIDYLREVTLGFLERGAVGPLSVHGIPLLSASDLGRLPYQSDFSRVDSAGEIEGQIAGRSSVYPIERHPGFRNKF